MAVVITTFQILIRCVLGLFSIKGLVLASAVLLMVWGDLRPDAVRQLDARFVQWAQILSPAREVKSDIAYIQMEPEQLTQLQLDPVSSPALPLLIQNKKIALITAQAMREQPLMAEQVLQSVSLQETEYTTQWYEKVSLAKTLQRRIESGDLLVGLSAAGVSSFPEQAYPVATANWLQEGISKMLPESYGEKLAHWINASLQLSAPLREVNPQLQGAGYRAVANRNPGQPYPLLWLQESQFHGDLALALFSKNLEDELKVKTEPQILFNNGYGIEMPHLWLPVSNNSEIITADFGGQVMEPFTLNEALSHPPQQSIWIVAASSQQAEVLAATFLALQTQQYFYQPFWVNICQSSLIILLTVYLLGLQPLLRLSMAFMLMMFITGTMAIAQITWQLSFHQILPLPLLVQWFVPASLFMMLWKYKRHQQLRWQWGFHNRSFELAQLCYQQGNLDQSLNTLADCKTTESVLSLLYDIAVQQERKRSYQQAADTYDVILQRKPKYKDAQKRALALRKLQQPSSSATDFSATHSLVMPAQEFSNPILGRYEIERELGRGAMGVVYLGLDPKISRRVAIKTLSYREFDNGQLQQIKQRFFREAEAAGRLNHPNIVTVYDVGEEDDLAFIAMDYVEGVSLDRCVSQTQLLSVQEVYEIVASVADALSYAHAQNIVHRDIKPANILYDADTGQVKVADFGIARIVDDSKTKTGDMLGSPVYMSPEQLKGSKVTGASDIYSLGVTLYQLLTGVLPYNGDSIANLAYLILNKKYISVREVRPELSTGIVRIVNKAMHKEPSRRYEDASAMADALRGLCSREFGKKAS